VLFGKNDTEETPQKMISLVPKVKKKGQKGPHKGRNVILGGKRTRSPFSKGKKTSGRESAVAGAPT